jgi:hypothetical protein
MNQQKLSFDIVQSKLAAADEVTKAKLKNLTSVGLLKSMISQVEMKVTHFEAVLRVMDFLQGMENEFTKDLKDAGLLVEHVESPDKQLVEPKKGLLVPESYAKPQ